MEKVENEPAMQINITAEDIQAVMQKNPMFVLQTEIAAYKRTVSQMSSQIASLEEELKKLRSGKGET
jgi:polyhydroxyalkanoate synthesis regulator phasin